MQTAEQKRSYFKAYDARRSADPVHQARKQERGRAAYLKLRADPEKYAQRVEESRLRMSKRRAAIKDDPAGWLALLLRSASARAAKRGLVFTIAAEDIELPEFCPVLGVKLLYGGQREQHGASLDRLKNSEDYVPGNVRVISWLANRLRSNCDDPAVFEALARDARSRSDSEEA